MLTETSYVARTFRAMNTAIEMLIYPAEGENLYTFTRQAETAAARVEKLFEEIVACLSRFQPDSELSRLNHAGKIEPASPLLYEAVSAALEMAQLTGGIFDPTVLEALENAGYDRSYELIGESRATVGKIARFSFPNFEGYREVKLDPARRSITLPYGVRLDLGGIGKGLAVDKASALLKQAGFSNFMVSAGGDMCLCGSEPENPAGWQVAVENPLNPEEELASLALKDCAVATSTIMKRRWVANGQTQHHLIDPRNGKPVVNELAAVTVIAPTTRQADALAKTALIMGLEEGQKFIERQPECAALFVRQDGSIKKSQNLSREK